MILVRKLHCPGFATKPQMKVGNDGVMAMTIHGLVRVTLCQTSDTCCVTNMLDT